MPEDKESKTTVWLKVLLALIPVLGAIIVGYWQFVYRKPKLESVKTTAYTGRVRDGTTDRPIYRAKVSIEEDQKVPQIQKTDSEGIFRVNLLETTKEVRIVVEAEGYRVYERRVSVTRTGTEDIRLEPSVISLPVPSPSPTPRSRLNVRKSPRQPTARDNCNSEDILLGRC